MSHFTPKSIALSKQLTSRWKHLCHNQIFRLQLQKYSFYLWEAQCQPSSSFHRSLVIGLRSNCQTFVVGNRAWDSPCCGLSQRLCPCFEIHFQNIFWPKIRVKLAWVGGIYSPYVVSTNFIGDFFSCSYLWGRLERTGMGS